MTLMVGSRVVLAHGGPEATTVFRRVRGVKDTGEVFAPLGDYPSDLQKSCLTINLFMALDHSQANRPGHQPAL